MREWRRIETTDSTAQLDQGVNLCSLAAGPAPPYGESMRKLLVVLALGLGAMGFKCEAATFTCTDVGTDELTCFCAVDQSLCGEMGDCMMRCPVQ